MLKRKTINKAFTIILISLLLITPSLADDDSKKCVVYRDGKLMYNPDNPKIHCTTLQLLDDFWSDHDVNVPNPDKKPEDFAEILTMKDIISNGKNACNSTPTIQNGTFPSKTVSEGTKITGQCDEGYSGSITAVCSADGSWEYAGSCEEEKLCENPITQTNANAFTETTLKYGEDAITATCQTGYTGSITATCNADGSWEYAGSCEGTLAAVDCGDGTLTGDKENGYCTYNYTGSQQTFKSSGISQVFLKVWGAQGGNISESTGGKGGYSYGSLTLDSGTTNLYVYVGGMGVTQITQGKVGAGGWNGGGSCYNTGNGDCGGGGGATDIRKGGTDITNRIIVAGGGGGSGYSGSGGAGGGRSNDGEDGKTDNNYGSDNSSYATGGIRGTSTEPGKGGELGKRDTCNGHQPGNDGEGPNGGNTNESKKCYSAGGGGGGYYGGGSGAIASYGTGGGGGSGYVGGVSDGGGSNGVKSGRGLARICWGSYADSSNCPGL